MTASMLAPVTGVQFPLGTLRFTNGAWYGSSRGNPSANVPSYFDFRLQTQSANAAFNQTFEGSVVLVVHSTPTGTDLTSQPGQDAEADWLYLTGENTAGTNPVRGLQSTNALRVFDSFAAPLGASTTATAELWAVFGSLSLLELRNPTGGNFVTSAITALDPQDGTPLTVVPEPSSLLLLAAGLVGCTAMRARRRAN